MQLPEPLLNSLAGIKGFDKEAFEKVHLSGERVTSIRVNPLKPPAANREWPRVIGQVSISGQAPLSRLQIPHNPITTPIPWSRYGHYLSSRPSFTFDPLFHAGCYYVQEASSMFLEQALQQTIDLSKPLKILDLCAAPGGKSTHIQSLISNDSLLVSNEVIKARAATLKDNCIKWGGDNVVVTNNDPKDFARLENYFDVMVVDAPCSGSGLFRRDEEAIHEWSINNVALCSQRQQRILADAWPALKEGGILIYATCSYSMQEDEEIMDWISGEMSVKSCPLVIDSEWNIVPVQTNSGNLGFRFWPYNLKGEGFFLSCFLKTSGGEKFSVRVKNKLEFAGKKETAIIQKWMKDSSHRFIQKNNTVYAIPGRLQEDINILLSSLRVQYSGIVVGEIYGDSLAPAHSLAMTGFVNEAIARAELDDGAAIQFLQRKDFDILLKEKGWNLVTYHGYNLGWVKVLANRNNNYYPKELRILKDL